MTRAVFSRVPGMGSILARTKSLLGSDAEPAVPADAVYEIGRTTRGRRTVRALDDLGATSLDDLVEVVACIEYDCSLAELRSQQRKRVYVSLYQTHVPNLVDHGLAEYDGRRTDIVPTEALAEVRELLDVVDERTVEVVDDA